MDTYILYYGIISTLESVGWGLYFTFIVRYISVVLGGETRSLIVFLASNWGFTLLSILIGGFLRTLGERRTLLLGVLCSLPPLVILFSYNPFVIGIVASMSAFPWGLMWSIVLKDIFTGSEKVTGLRYGLFTAGRGLGFFAGSLLTGLLYAVSNVAGVVLAISVILLTSALCYYYLYGGSNYNRKTRSVGVGPIIRKLWVFYVSLVFTIFARELFYSIAPPKLDSDIKLVLRELPEWVAYTVFGLVYSGGALVSPVARFIAGKLVDKHGPRLIYISTVLAYVITYWAFVKTTGLTSILIWQIPLFPFLDTSLNVYIAKQLAHELIPLGVAAGLTFTSIGGLLVVLMLALGGFNAELGGFVVTAVCATAVLLALVDKARKDP